MHDFDIIVFAIHETKNFEVGMKKNNFKANVKDTHYTLAPINWILKLFALNCVYRKNSQLVVRWSKIQNFILIVILLIVVMIFLYGKVTTFEENENGSIKFNDLIEMTFLLNYTQYIIDLFYVFKSKHLLINYYNSYDHIDKIIGMTYYKGIRKSITYTVIINNVINVLTAIMDYLAWCLHFGCYHQTIFAIDYFFIWLTTLTIQDLTAQVIQVMYRLKTIENLLKNKYTALRISDIDPLNNFWISESRIIKKHKDLLNLTSHNQLSDVVSLRRCYLMLLEQAECVNYIYGFRIVLFSFEEIIWMVNEINIAIRVCSGILRPDFPVAYIPGITSLMRFGTLSTILLLVRYCEQTYKKNKDIVNILDLIILNGNLSTELKSSLLELRDLMLYRPITFHAADYFTINKKLLVSICSVVVTYSIILLQSMK
uniref:Gustatory receptor n=1 Tax=Dendrolimus punctatus TaxID=238572 RepID=A0A2K8GL73_9NEOP|nr:antennal gustatory receptor 63 [Dendrolimus punctatus]